MTVVLLSPPTYGQRPTFGIDPSTLTANEASYRRLRAKGFQLEARPAPLSQEGDT